MTNLQIAEKRFREILDIRGNRFIKEVECDGYGCRQTLDLLKENDRVFLTFWVLGESDPPDYCPRCSIARKPKPMVIGKFLAFVPFAKAAS